MPAPTGRVGTVDEQVRSRQAGANNNGVEGSARFEWRGVLVFPGASQRASPLGRAKIRLTRAFQQLLYLALLAPLSRQLSASLELSLLSPQQPWL